MIYIKKYQSYIAWLFDYFPVNMIFKDKSTKLKNIYFISTYDTSHDIHDTSRLRQQRFSAHGMSRVVEGRDEVIELVRPDEETSLALL